jgi:HAD superfamily phosphatase (TIGR01668 family)
MDIPLESLRRKKIASFILDLDNTVTEWNSNHLSPEIRGWVKKVKGAGGKACIVSNNSDQRVRGVAQVLDIPYVCRAGKPRRRAFRRALELMGTGPDQTAVVGDQIFTDILGGNRMGMVTILVTPLAKREFLGTRITRQLERLVLKRLKGPGCPEL